MGTVKNAVPYLGDMMFGTNNYNEEKNDKKKKAIHDDLDTVFAPISKFGKTEAGGEILSYAPLVVDALTIGK